MVGGIAVAADGCMIPLPTGGHHWHLGQVEKERETLYQHAFSLQSTVLNKLKLIHYGDYKDLERASYL